MRLKIRTYCQSVKGHSWIDTVYRIPVQAKTLVKQSRNFTVELGVGPTDYRHQLSQKKIRIGRILARMSGSRSGTQTYRIVRSFMTRVGYVVTLRWLVR